MHIGKRTLSLLLALGLAGTSLPAIGQAADAEAIPALAAASSAPDSSGQSDNQKDAEKKTDNENDKKDDESKPEDPVKEEPGKEEPAPEDPVKEEPQNPDPGTEDPEQPAPGPEDPENPDPGTEDPEEPIPGEEDPGENTPTQPEEPEKEAGNSQKKRDSSKKKPYSDPADKEIKEKLEEYDETIQDPDYDRAFQNYQEFVTGDEFTAPELFGVNPFTATGYVHKHPKTKYIYRGIDVSKWQGTIDWNAAKRAGVTFAFIRCGTSDRAKGAKFKTMKDEYFEQNVVNATAAGIPVGVYYYSCAGSATEAKKEAEYIIGLLKPYKNLITLPAIMDYETTGKDRVWDIYKRTSRKQRTKFATTFCNTLAKAGYQSGVYASRAWMYDFFDMSKLSKHHHWVAEWNKSTSYTGAYDFWQFSDSGRVNGINGKVDCDFWYTDSKLTNANNLADNLATGTASITLEYSSTNFTGTARKPALTVICNQTVLSPETDYSVTYSANKAPGTAKVKVTGAGAYSGTISKTFKIVAPTAPYTTLLKATYRSGPGTQYAKKGAIAKGTHVDVVYGWYKTVKGVNWHLVKVGKKYYYMAAKYLAPQTLVRYSAAAKLPYRTAAGTRYKVKGKFKKGDAVQVVKGWHKKANGYTWYKVRVGAQDYYTQAKFLKKTEALTTYTVAKTVNLRSKAGLSTKLKPKTLKGKLLPGTPVNVVMGSTQTFGEEKWFQIKVNAKYYYVLSSYLDK
jgi:GH25 family lysozyme M1 (1,4-beta-N-acetylmuramidase)/uncharacterized protein YgiM (DUF1202 family)